MNVLTLFPRWRKVLQCLPLLVVTVFAFGTSLSLSAQTTPQITEMLKKHQESQRQAFTPPKQLTFIENKGQWQGNAELGTPRFLAKLGGANIWVTDDGLVYDFYKRQNAGKAASKLLPHLAAEEAQKPERVEGHVMKMKFRDANAIGANANGATTKTTVRGMKQQSGFHNYFLGNDSTKWATDVPLYDEVVIGEVYDGIAAKIYFEGNSVRYDMIVEPGADPSKIALSFEGTEHIFTSSSGDLVMKTSLGDVVQGKLFAYQVINGKKHQIPCTFALNAHHSTLNTDNISFALGSYDLALPLVIDPVLWSTFVGGAGADEVYDLKIDGSGNSYLAGRTPSTNFPMVGGSYQTMYQGGAYDGFVTKVNPTGTALVYSTFLGGTLNDQLQAVAVDASGNAYVAGQSFSGYPTTGGVIQTTFSGNGDGVVTKLNATGSVLLYSTYIGGSNAANIFYDIAVDGSGNAFVSGHTYSTNFPVTGGVYQSSSNGASEGVVCKLNPTATALVYSTYIGGVGNDYPVYCEIDGSGNVYLVGYAAAGYPTTGGAHQTAYGGGTVDIVVTKLNSTGTAPLIYSTYIGGTGDDLGFGFQLDASNNAIISGSSTGGFPTTLGPAYAGGTKDGILLSLNATGSGLNFARYIGGSGEDVFYGLARDGGTGEMYTLGYSDSPNYPTSVGAYQTTALGGYNVILSKIDNAASTLLYSTYICGANDDIGQRIAFSAANTVYISGSGSTAFPTSAGVVQPGLVGISDGFVAQFLTVPEAPTVTSFTATTGYPGLGIVINGTNFTGVTQVQFGGVVSPSFNIISPTQLVAAVPAGGATGSVSVTGPGGTGSLPGFTFTGTVPQVSTFAGNGAGAGYADGTQGAALFNNPYGIAIDAGGNIYEADRNNHRIRKIIPAGVVTTLAGSGVAGWNDATGTAAQFNQPAGLAVDAGGNVYVADAQNHRIRKITPGGVVTTFAGSGVAGWNDATGTAAQFNAPYGVAVDGAGNVYVGDGNNHRIRKITSGGVVTTFAGSGVAGWNDATGTAAQFNAPTFVALDGSGNLYVGDNLNHRIRKITSAGVVTTLAGSGVAGWNDATGAAAQFNQPYGVTVDAAGNVYVADFSNHRIRFITPSGVVSTLAGTGVAGFADGTSAAAQFNSPHSIVVDATGNLYVGDYNNHRIRKIAPAAPTVTSFTPTSAYPMQVVTVNGTNLTGASQVQFGGINAAWYNVVSATQIQAVVPFGAAAGNVSVTTIGGTAALGGFTVAVVPAISTHFGDGTPAYLDAAGQAARVSQPIGVVISSAGDMYIAEAGNHIIRKISASGVSSVFAGSPGANAFLDATGTAARFDTPHYLAIDGSDNIYVADYNNHRIRKITPAGVVTTLSGSGTFGFADGAGATAQFQCPIGIAYSAGFVYVTEDCGHRIRKIDAVTGNVAILAGSTAGISGYMDAIGTAALFNGARGIAVDAAGNVCVTDFNNNRIRKVTPGGVVTTLAGSGGGFADGIGTAAQFNQPRGLTIDAAGNLYVADGNNVRIRLVTPCGAVTTIAASGTPGTADGTLTTGQLSGGIEGLAFSPASGDLFAADRNQHLVRKISIPRYQFISGDAGSASNWKQLPGLTVSALNFTNYGSVFTVPAGATATATTSFTLGANTAISVADNATLNLNNVTLTNNGALSIADGATGGRLLLNGTGGVLSNSACYAGANATLESAGGTAKTLNTSELPNPMPGKVVVNNTVGVTTPAAVNIGATGSVSVNSGAHMIIPSGGNLQHNNATALSFTVNNGGTLEIQGIGQISLAASTLNYIAGSTLLYSGAAAKATTTPEFPLIMAGNLTITNTALVTLDAAKTLGASATLTLTAGRIVTSGVNMLTITNTAAGAVVATAGYVDGPLQRDMPSSLAAPAVTYSFPLGVGATPYPFAISNPTTGAVGPRLQMQAFASNAGGTVGTGISLLSTTEYWQMQQISGNYTSGIIFLQKAGLTATNTIGGNPIVPTGTYNGFISTFGTGLTTVAPVTGTGCFLVGTGPIIYDWTNGGGDNLWTNSANWSPTRSTPAPTDILRFNPGTWSPTNVPTESIQQLIVSGFAGLDVSAPQTLSIGSGGVQVTATGHLSLTINFSLALNINAGATFTVDGILNVGANVITGAGSFALNAGASLYTYNDDGVNGISAGTGTIQVPGANITYSPMAKYAFTATYGANRLLGFAGVAGKPAITQCANLVISVSPNARVLDNALTADLVQIQGILQTAAQTLTLSPTGMIDIQSGGRLIASAGGTIVNNNPSGTSFTVQSGGVLECNGTGQVSPASASAVNYVVGSTLDYAGSLAKTTNNKEIGASGVQQLLISNSQPVTLGADAVVQQLLTVNNGSKLILSNAGNPTLTLNGSLNLNASGSLASVNGANAGSLTLGGTGALPIRLDPTDNTLNNFTVSRSGIHTITGDLNVRGTLNLLNGILLPTTRIFSGDPAGTAAGVITGGNPMTYVQGALQRRFTGGIVANGTNYAFPVGSISGFRGATLVDVKTGASPVVQMDVTDAGAVTADMTLTALFGPRNWRVQTVSGVFNGSAIVLTESGLTSSNVVARSVVQSGAYTNVGGNNVGVSVTSGANGIPAGANHYFAVASVQPVVTSISPSIVSPGDTLTITGVSLGAVSSVGIGGIVAASFQVISNTQIKVVVGAGASGAITLISPTGVAQSAQTVTFLNAPAITSFTPTYGTTGSTIRIVGNRFTGAINVNFGGLNAISFMTLDANTIDAVVNLGNSGLVTVQTPGGLGASSVPFDFILKPSIVNFFPKWARAGDTVNIYGGSFTRASGVQFGRSAYKTLFTIVTSGQIRIVVPDDASTGMIRVQNPVGTDSSWTDFTFVGQPRLFSAQPSGITGIGQPILLTGSELHPVPIVRIGSVTASSVTWTDLTRISATFAQATTGLLTVIASGGTVSLPTPMQIILPPVISSFSPLLPSPGDIVTVTGANFVPGAVSIRIGGVSVSSLTVNSSTRITFVVPPVLAGPIAISAPGGIVTSSGASLGIVPPPFILDASGSTSATIGQSIVLRGTGLLNIVGLNIGGTVVSTFATLDTLGTRLWLTVPAVPGLDSAASALQTTEATIGLLTRSGAATYTMFFTNRIPTTTATSTNANSTNGTMNGNTQALMQITAISPVNLPEGSNVTLQGVNIATTATVWMRSGGEPFRLLTEISSQSTTAIIARIPEGTVSPLLLSTEATLLVSTATRQVVAPFPIQVNALNVPQFVTFQPLTGNTRAIVSIVGQNFAASSLAERGSVRSVSIGGVAVAAFRVVSPTLIQVTVGSVRSGFVRVETASGVLLSQQSFTLDTTSTTEVIPPEPVVSKDSLALNRLFAATEGTRWTTSTNWTNKAPISFRFGVKVQSGRVVELRLPNIGLRGTFPPDVLQDLDALRVLDVSNNALVGVIPSEITKAINLEVMRFAGNQFSGRLPQGLCALTRLREVDLSGNSIQDSLASLCCLQQVTVLNLRGNKFTGTMPACIGNMQNIVTLDLSRNAITGAVPDAIGLLTQLSMLNLRGNRFTGSFPKALGRLNNNKQVAKTTEALGLTAIDLGENGFSGAISDEIGAFPNVRNILLDRNQFSGGIPKTLLLLNGLRRLDVSRNELSSAPDLNVIPRLDTLNVEYNRFSIDVLEQFVGKRLLTYFPQEFAQPRIWANGRETAGAITVLVNDSLRLSVPKSGRFNRTTWKRNGVVLSNGTDTSVYADFRLPAFALRDTGVYECVITNSQLTEIVLTTAQVRVLGQLPAVVPAAVSLIAPSLGEEDVAVVPDFVWTSSQVASAYRMELATDTSFSQRITVLTIAQSSEILASGRVVAPKPNQSSTGSGFPLAFDKRFVWRVRAENGVGASAWAVGSFTTAAPDAQLTIAPLNLGKVSRYDTARGTLVLRNLGVGALTIESVQADNTAFQTEDVRGVVQSGGEVQIPVRFVARTVGNASLSITVRFRSGMSNIQQTRTLANRLAVRVSGVKLIAPAFDTVVVGRTRISSTLLVNMDDKPITVQSTALRQKVGQYTFRFKDKEEVLQPGDTLILPMGCLAQQAGKLPRDTVRCISYNVAVEQLRREDLDTAQVELKAFARVQLPTDVPVQIGVRALDTDVPPGGTVRLEIFLSSSRPLDSIFKAAVPTIGGRIRWNENVLVLDRSETGVRRMNGNSRSADGFQSYTIPRTNWAGRSQTLLQIHCLAVAGSTSATALVLEELDWGAGNVLVDSLIDGLLTTKVSRAGGVRLITPAKTSVILASIAPNPAKEAMDIRYTISGEGGFVEMSLLDVRGTVVQTLKQEVQRAGDYTLYAKVGWLSSGSYTVRVSVNGGDVETQQVQIVR